MIWDAYGVKFARHEPTPELYFIDWNVHFPAASRPVMALSGAPADYPVLPENRSIQKHLVWVDAIRERSLDFVRQKISQAFLAVHFRNGSDWDGACRAGMGWSNFMSSPQCTLPEGKITWELCKPTLDQAFPQLLRTLDATNTTAVYVGSDDSSIRDNISRAFKAIGR